MNMVGEYQSKRITSETTAGLAQGKEVREEDTLFRP